jgi:hypothetical protein
MSDNDLATRFPKAEYFHAAFVFSPLGKKIWSESNNLVQNAEKTPEVIETHVKKISTSMKDWLIQSGYSEEHALAFWQEHETHLTDFIRNALK